MTSSQHKKEWKPINKVSSLMAHISLENSVKDEWYFDSGCSRHMTGINNLLSDLRPYSTNHVTFGDGTKCKIEGICRLIRT